MSLEGLIAGLILVALTLAAILPPLFRRRGTTIGLDRQRERALAYYERVLTNIRDLDEDHNTGKIGMEEYQHERELWASRGAALLRLLDELDHRQPIASRDADDAAIDAAIEDAIQSARQTTPRDQVGAVTAP